MAQYENILMELGLAKNGARIYETLIREGECGAGKISTKSGVHRRNVYDSLNRLIENGLVFERVTSTEHLYQATDPIKLMDLVKEKEEKVQDILPNLEKLYYATPHEDDVIVYRGVEGWKNYLRDIIRIGEDVYTISANGVWQDKHLEHIVAQTARESKRKKMKMHWLFDNQAKGTNEPYITKGFDVEYRYLPKGYDTQTTIDIFGDHVVIVSDPTPDAPVGERSVVTLINKQTADAFRTWFKLLWSASEPVKIKKKVVNTKRKTHNSRLGK